MPSKPRPDPLSRTAAELIRASIAIDPAQPAAHSNLALALLELQELTAALASCDAALTLQPDYAEALNNRGNALHRLLRHNEAVASYDRALQLGPENGQHRVNRSLLLLVLGSFADGWREYEWRRKTDDWVDRKFQRPECIGINAVLSGWARTRISDAELLAKGIECFEGLYQGLIK